MNIGGFSDAVFNVSSAFLADNNQQFVAEVEAIELQSGIGILPVLRRLEAYAKTINTRGRISGSRCLYLNSSEGEHTFPFLVRIDYDDSRKARIFNHSGIMQTTEIDIEYQRRVNAMSIKEKIERSAAMLAWTRQQIAARIRKQFPAISDEQLKWHVALKLYESEPAVVAMIQDRLANVSG